MARNDDGTGARNGDKFNVMQRMAAFDALPKIVRQELSGNALLDYEPVHFYLEWKEGLSPMGLLEALWKANIRDHKTKAKKGEVAAISDSELPTYKFSPDPIREGRTFSPRSSRLSRLREVNRRGT